MTPTSCDSRHPAPPASEPAEPSDVPPTARGPAGGSWDAFFSEPGIELGPRDDQPAPHHPEFDGC